MNNKFLSVVTASIIFTSGLSAKVFATVNGAEITEKDIALIVKDPRIDVSTLPVHVQKQILDQTIDAKLLESEALKSGVLNKIEFKENLAKLKGKLALDFFIKDKIESIKIDESEIKAKYSELSNKEEVKASHILVKMKKEADDIIVKLNNSKDVASDFVQLAKEFSIGPSATKGGDLGYFTKEKMVPAFSKAVFALSKDNFTKEAVKTRFGFHIILVKDKRKVEIAPLEKIKDQFVQSLKYDKLQTILKDSVDKLRKTAKIVIN